MSNDDSTSKYKEYFDILKEDLKNMMDKNKLINKEIQEVEEERQYYIEKLKTVIGFCELHADDELADNIIKIIKHIPEDFK
jgi:hypothetical protein